MFKAYDVLIMGGGLSGLTLAIQLKRREDNIRILVVEKAAYPVPEAAHKVGESSVEIASHYFDEILGLKVELENELPKLGLRFFILIGITGILRNVLNLGRVFFQPLKVIN